MSCFTFIQKLISVHVITDSEAFCMKFFCLYVSFSFNYKKKQLTPQNALDVEVVGYS